MCNMILFINTLRAYVKHNLHLEEMFLIFVNFFLRCIH